MNLYTITEQGQARPWAPITFNLPADVENEIMFDVAEQIKREIWADIETALPEFRLPIAVQPSREARLAMYTAKTAEVDYPFLRDRQYLKKFRAGLYPALQSPFWLDLVDMPPVFEFVQRDFLRLTNFIEDSQE